MSTAGKLQLIGPRPPGTLGPGGMAWLLVVGVPIASVVLLSFKPLHHPPVVQVLFMLQLAGIGTAVLAASRSVTGAWFGLLVTGLNRYSLSRAQMLAWTLLLVVGLLTAAEINILEVYGKCIAGTQPCPGLLAIDIPQELLAAAGISVFSAVAAPALLSLKSDADADPDQQRAAASKTSRLTGQAVDSVTALGKVVANKRPADAHWSDLISGEEIGNAGSVDLSKVQQLLVTLLLIGVYAGALVKLFGGQTWIKDMPPFSVTLVEMMAISHAGYLFYKASPKPGQGDAGAAVNALPAPLAARPNNPPPLPRPASVAGPKP